MTEQPCPIPTPECKARESIEELAARVQKLEAQMQAMIVRVNSHIQQGCIQHER